MPSQLDKAGKDGNDDGVNLPKIKNGDDSNKSKLKSQDDSHLKLPNLVVSCFFELIYKPFYFF